MLEDYMIGYDPSYKVFFYACWYDWEEDGWLFIFEKEDKYFYLEGGYSVMDIHHRTPVFQRDLQPFSNEDDVLSLMEEWAECEEVCDLCL